MKYPCKDCEKRNVCTKKDCKKRNEYKKERKKNIKYNKDTTAHHKKCTEYKTIYEIRLITADSFVIFIFPY